MSLADGLSPSMTAINVVPGIEQVVAARPARVILNLRDIYRKVIVSGGGEA
jgi:hypothetical protein